jgi:DNA-binding PadR family transcriptional regulator
MTTISMIPTPDTELILFDADQRQYYNLDALAAAVWSLVYRPMTLSEIRDAIAERFDLEPETVESHILDLLNEMETKGLIETAAD